MHKCMCVAGALSAFTAVAACGLDGSAVIVASGSGSDGGATSDGASDARDGSGGDASGGDASGDSGTESDSGDDSGSATSKLVYANTSTDIWSYDVVSGVLKDIAPIGCAGANQADLAIDATGQAYIDVKSDAVYKISLVDGTCSARNVLDDLTGDRLHIAARAAGTPGFLAVDSQNGDLIALDPVAAGNAHVTTITNDYFVDTVPHDVVCNSLGGCWTALQHTNCASSGGTACLYAFPADGSSSPISLGAVAMIPAGLTYANGSLYAFGDDGRIYQINTSGTPVANEKLPTMIVGAAAEPAAWVGAASSSTY